MIVVWDIVLFRNEDEKCMHDLFRGDVLQVCVCFHIAGVAKYLAIVYFLWIQTGISIRSQRVFP